MRGVILAGGLGSRLHPLTSITNKHLLPVFDRPMIFYPINTLVTAGIKEILIVVSGPHAGNFMPILKNGEDLGCNIRYAYQEKPDGGIADALALAENFTGEDDFCLILGDNTTDADISPTVKSFASLRSQYSQPRPIATLFLKQVDNPSDFGIAEFDDLNYIQNIIEKPQNPKSNWAVTGVYLYDKNVYKFIKQCKPSGRGQLEITDVNNFYVKYGGCHWIELEGFWQDAGTFKNLYKANKFWAEKDHGD